MRTRIPTGSAGGSIVGRGGPFEQCLTLQTQATLNGIAPQGNEGSTSWEQCLFTKTLSQQSNARGMHLLWREAKGSEILKT